MLRLNHKPEIKDWVILKNILPSEFTYLIELCIDYYKLRNNVYTFMPNIETEFGQTNKLMQSIISEYKRIIQIHLKDKENLKLVDEDIKKILTIFFDQRTGRMQIDVLSFKKARDENWLGLFFSTYTFSFDSFIEDRIYSVLRNVWENLTNEFYGEKFVYYTVRKAGIFPAMAKKEGFVAEEPIPTEPKGKKEEEE